MLLTADLRLGQLSIRIIEWAFEGILRSAKKVLIGGIKRRIDSHYLIRTSYERSTLGFTNVGLVYRQLNRPATGFLALSSTFQITKEFQESSQSLME